MEKKNKKREEYTSHKDTTRKQNEREGVGEKAN